MPPYPFPALPQRIRIFPVAALLALAAGFGGCPQDAPQAKKSGKGPEKIPVLAVSVARKTVPLRVEALGNVEPFMTVAVKSRVEGQLLNAHFREGEAVAQGQLLFEIDARPYQAQLRQAQANLARDRAQWENAKATLRRYEELQGRQFVSGEMLSTARTNAWVYAANIEADAAAAQSAQLLVEYATIRSPLSGRTGRLLVHPGNQVKADSVLVVINQMEPVRVNFAIPEQQLAALRAVAQAGEVNVRAQPDGGAAASGKLSFIDNSVDAATGTIKLKATFANPGQPLWAGQFVRVSVDLQAQAGAIVIPAQAAQTGPKGSYVFAIKPDLTVEKRDIVVERTQDGEAVVAGLREGEQIVLDGQSRLVDGAAVDIRPGQ
ncbi:MAG: efflux RND transporter periplasmic adaptor subunit [Candidatus Methylumidiphilus sp.]